MTLEQSPKQGGSIQIVALWCKRLAKLTLCDLFLIQLRSYVQELEKWN